MELKIIKIIILFFIFSCSRASFKYEEKEIYIHTQEGVLIITALPKGEKSSDYLEVVDDGDRFDKLLIYVNLCDSSYHVIVRGRVKIVGNPEFTYEEIGWYFDERQKRLEREYSLKSDCKFRYYE